MKKDDEIAVLEEVGSKKKAAEKGEWAALLNLIDKILLRCVLLALGFILFWFAVHMMFGEWGYKIHSELFTLSQQEYELLNYYGMSAAKIISVILFLIPWISVKLVKRAV